jgi:hypothetical protein
MRFISKSWLLVPSIALLIAGCAQGEDTRFSGRPEAAQAPVLGAADGFDSADGDCQVVLRKASRPAAPGGFETVCVEGGCWFLWAVEVDVSREALERGAVPKILYQSGIDATWWSVDAEPGSDLSAGHGRFRFRIFEHTVSPGMSLTALQRARIQLIPYLLMPNGGRLFDHNRIVDPLRSYELVEGNGWALGDDPAVCAGSPASVERRATLRFLTGWQQRQHGAIVEGGTLRVEYDPARLTTCRASYTYAPAWGIEGFVRFQPGGELYQAPVVDFETGPYGQVLDRPRTGSMEVPVPRGASHAEIWFRNWSGMSYPCEAYDSNFGDNYLFGVTPSANAPREVLWAGDWGNGLSRECLHRPGLEDPLSLDSYLMQRACLDIYADVYVPGMTDQVEDRQTWLQAQVVYRLDSGEEQRAWLEPAGRIGNNYRVLWSLPRQELSSSSWSVLEYSFLFSTDGLTWYRIAQGAGPAGGAPRRILRAF